MITRLEVDGFKSLRSFAVDLEPFTVFIGPNSAGKSNVLEALGLLSRLASQPIAEAFKAGRGRPGDQFTRAGAETAQAMSFAVEFVFFGEYSFGSPPISPPQSRFRYELTIERQTLPSGTERLLARRERLHAMRGEEDSWMKARPEFVRYAAYAHGGTDTFVALVDERSMAQRIVGLPNSYPEELRVPASHTALAQGPAYVPVGRIRRDLSEGRWLRMGMAQLGEPSDRIGSGDLAPDAANLPTVLADLPPPVLGEIRADLVALVPGIASFDVVPDGDEMRIDFELSGGDRMPARLVSDGTLRILVLLTALRLEPRPALICIEEPENGIYPGRLRALLELFRSEAQRRHDDPEALAQLEALVRFDADGIGHHGLVGVSHNFLPTQILLTTHSPVILAALRKHPEHLRFVDAVRRDGHRFTRVRSVGKPVPGDLGRFTIAPREIDLLLNAAQSEGASMIYLRAGLFAEGRSDYDFLLRLLDRLLEAIAARLYPGAYEVGEAIGIDAPEQLRKGKRADRIAAAVFEFTGMFELLVIHADGDADPKAARSLRIEPGVAAVHALNLEHPPALVACVPVRETEAWMLTDGRVFRELLGDKVAPALPTNPEIGDPKVTLQQVLKDCGGRRLPGSIHAFFGERVDLTTLRRLPAFQTFEAGLTAAVREVARSQGHRDDSQST